MTLKTNLTLELDSEVEFFIRSSGLPPGGETVHLRLGSNWPAVHTAREVSLSQPWESGDAALSKPNLKLSDSKLPVGLLTVLVP